MGMKVQSVGSSTRKALKITFHFGVFTFEMLWLADIFATE
jgi:hypothetical protein